MWGGGRGGEEEEGERGGRQHNTLSFRWATLSTKRGGGERNLIFSYKCKLLVAAAGSQ